MFYSKTKLCASHLFCHFLTNTQQHKHVVTLCDAHGVEVTQHIGTGNAALNQKHAAVYTE